jgi:hypothetical protein
MKVVYAIMLINYVLVLLLFIYLFFIDTGGLSFFFVKVPSRHQ